MTDEQVKVAAAKVNLKIREFGKAVDREKTADDLCRTVAAIVEECGLRAAAASSARAAAVAAKEDRARFERAAPGAAAVADLRPFIQSLEWTNLVQSPNSAPRCVACERYQKDGHSISCAMAKALRAL